MVPDFLDYAWGWAGQCNPYGLYSHTLPAALLAGACVAGVVYLSGRNEAALLMFLLVLLHLPADLVTGHKLYWPGGELLGLGLYRHRMADFVVESLVLVGGWALLRRDRTTPRWAASGWTLLALVLVQGTADRFGAFKPSGCVDAGERGAVIAGP